VISATTHSPTISAPSAAHRRNAASERAAWRGSLIKTSRITLLSIAVRIACQPKIGINRGSTRKSSSSSPTRKRIDRICLLADEPATYSFERQDRPGSYAQPVPHPLWDRHLALLGNYSFHTTMVGIPTDRIKATSVRKTSLGAWRYDAVACAAARSPASNSTPVSMCTCGRPHVGAISKALSMPMRGMSPKRRWIRSGSSPLRP